MAGTVSLTYHEVYATRKGDSLSASAGTFRSHLQHLKDSGNSPAEPHTLFSGLAAPGKGKTVLITFDDGHRTHLAAGRVMAEEFGWKGLFFVSTGLTEKGPSWMTVSQLRELDQLGGCLQSHAHNHVFLNHLPPDRLREELSTSRKFLEDITGKAITAISFPGGRYSDAVLDVARDVGFRFFFTSRPRGFREALTGGGWILHRFMLHDGISSGILESFLEGDGIRIRFLDYVYHSKRVVRAVVGDEVYLRCWKRKEKFPDAENQPGR